MSLERMDDLFGVTELVKNIEADEQHEPASIGEKTTQTRTEQV